MSRVKRFSALATAGILALTTAVYFPQPVNADSLPIVCNESVVNSLADVQGDCKLTDHYDTVSPIQPRGDLTLDLNGFSFTNEDGYALTVRNDVNVTLKNSNSSRTAYFGDIQGVSAINLAATGAKLIIDAPNVEISGRILAQGEVEIKNGAVDKIDTNTSSGSLTISGGTVRGPIDYLGSKLTISDGTIGNLTVRGGASAEISGGNFTGTLSDGASHNGTLEISGGTFMAANVANFVADGYKVYKKDGVSVVEEILTTNDVMYPEKIELLEGQAVDVNNYIHVGTESEMVEILYAKNQATKNSGVFEVNRYTGQLTGTKAGEAKLDTTVYHGGEPEVRKTLQVVVSPRFSSLSVNDGQTLEIDKRQTVDLKSLISVNDEMNEDEIEWTISAANGEKYVKLDGFNLTGYGVTGRTETVTITAKDTVYGTTLTAELQVKVLPILDEFKAVDDDHKTIEMTEGDEPVDLSEYFVTNHKSLWNNRNTLEGLVLSYSSDNEDVAKVSDTNLDKAGKVVAGKPGEANITATMSYKNSVKTETIHVKVASTLIGVKVQNDGVDLSEEEGLTVARNSETKELAIVKTAAEAQADYSVTVEDPSVATVVVEGEILKVTPGTVGTTKITLTAKANDETETSTSFDYTVRPILTEVEVLNDEGEVVSGTTVELKQDEEVSYTLVTGDTDAQVTWDVDSEDQDVATAELNSEGKLVVVTSNRNVGETTITVIARSNYGEEEEASFTVKVKPTLMWAGVSFGTDEDGNVLTHGAIEAGETITLNPVTNLEGITPEFSYEIVDQYAAVDPEVEVATLDGDTLKGENIGYVRLKVTATYMDQSVDGWADVYVNPVEHEVVEGDGAEYDGEDLVQKIDAEMVKFRYLIVYHEDALDAFYEKYGEDSSEWTAEAWDEYDAIWMEVEPENYTVTAGSTIVTFAKEWLETLASGTYNVAYVFTDGPAYSQFVIPEPVEEEPVEDESTNNEITDIVTENEVTITSTTSKATKKAKAANTGAMTQENSLTASSIATVAAATLAAGIVLEAKRRASRK